MAISKNNIIKKKKKNKKKKMKKVVGQILKSFKIIKNSNEITWWLIGLTIVFCLGVIMHGFSSIIRSFLILIGLIIVVIHILLKVAAIIDDYIPNYGVGLGVFVCVVILSLKVSLFIVKYIM